MNATIEQSGSGSLPTVGSSDVAAILGMSPWASPWSAWTRLVGLVPRYNTSDTPAQARGRMLEPAIGARYALEQGVAIVPGPPITEHPLIHPTKSWMAARPDFFAGAAGVAPDRIVECKSARVLDADDGWGEAGTGRVPVHYAIQVAWQLAVVHAIGGVERCDLAVYATVTDDWRVYSLHRSAPIERRIIAVVEIWFERHVVEGVMPAIDGSADCGRALGLVHRSPTREWRQPSAEDRSIASDLARVRAELAALEQRSAALEHHLQSRIGDAYGLDGIATWAPRKGRARLDEKALRQAHPEIAQRFTVAGEPGRTFRFTYTESEESSK